jgi:hypothetical protein
MTMQPMLTEAKEGPGCQRLTTITLEVSDAVCRGIAPEGLADMSRLS